jgi:putative colanic acid biosynthesis acetyltransferase WcaF
MNKIRLYLGYFLNFIYNDVIAHIPVHTLRKGFLRIFNKNISASCVILMHGRILNFWNVRIGANSVINQFVLIDCRRYKVTIDDNVDIGPYTRIWTLAHDPNDDTHGITGGDVCIGHHVWIASGVTILPDLTIGSGAVIASGAVVTQNITEKEIVAGIPARKIGQRVNALSYTLRYTPIFE